MFTVPGLVGDIPTVFAISMRGSQYLDQVHDSYTGGDRKQNVIKLCCTTLINQLNHIENVY